MYYTSSLHPGRYSIYPGEFVPLMDEEEVRNELRRKHRNKVVYPPMNMKELPDSFIIEVAMPGVKREELLINTDENILSISVVHREYRSHALDNFKMHEFNYEFFDKHIVLPDNVDADFVSAEYREGILHLHLPKTSLSTKKLHTRVVVY